MSTRLTQALLEQAVGGAAALVQLLDKDGDGVADAALVTAICEESDGEINAYISPAVNVSSPQVATAPFLLRLGMDVGCYLAWLRGGHAQAMPAEVKVAYERAGQKCQDIRDRKMGIGTATQPASSSPIQQVEIPAAEDYFRSTGPRRRFDGWS